MTVAVVAIAVPSAQIDRWLQGRPTGITWRPLTYATLSAPATERDGALRALGSSALHPVAPPIQPAQITKRLYLPLMKKGLSSRV